MRSLPAVRSLPHTLYLLLSLAFLITFLITLWMTFYSPVNADEIFWKLMIARLEGDEGKLVYLFAQCREGQWIDAPLTWYPAMWINAWFYEDASQPWDLRIHGWVVFLILIGLWTWLLRQRSGLGLPDSFLAVTAFLSVGVMPFLMVFERPEQPLLLLLTMALLTTLVQQKTSPASSFASVKRAPPIGWGAGLLVVLGFALIGTLMSGTHPKGMFLFPVLLVLAWRQLRSWLLVLLLAGILGWTAFDTQQVWQLRTSCPEFPGLMKVLQSLTLRPGMLFSDPLGFIKAGWANLMAFGAYVSSLEFRQSYISSWLPVADSDWSIREPLVLLANALLWVPLAVAVLVIGSNWLSRRRIHVWSDALLWLCLAMALSSILVLQTAKNFYEASIVWPLILLLMIFSFGRPVTKPKGPVVRTLLSILIGVALVSGIVRFDRFGDVTQEWRSIRIDQTEREDLRNEALQEFARQECAIGEDSKRLVLDKDSYQSFWEHEQPIFLDYAAGWWGAEADIRKTLRDRQVGGLVGKCERVPEVLRPFMIQDSDGSGATGGFCCIAAQHLR